MKSLFYTGICLIILLNSGCNKSGFLDTKPDQSLVVPKTLADYQAILDGDQDMNGMGNGLMRGPIPNLGEASADNYTVLDQNIAVFQPQNLNIYTWQKEVYTGAVVNDWNRPYLSIFNCNIVLDGLAGIDRTGINGTDYDRVKGTALFLRAHAFYQLAQVFAPPYRQSTAATLWGVPLRLTADFGEKTKRATLEETYSRITNDLQLSKQLLSTGLVYKTRPSRQAAFGLLARVYQTMQDYQNASLYADSCLQINASLLDYNELDAKLNYPFVGGNQEHSEVIFSCNMETPLTTSTLYSTQAYMDKDLYNSYATNDLRKVVFFRSYTAGYRFKGSYDGRSFNFAGISTDEIYLIRAECLIRTGKIAEGLQDLNLLMTNRWKKVNGISTFIPFTAGNREEALQLVLNERRKELIFRGLRWTDLRRLNLEGRNIGLSRTVNGINYTLPANDPRWTLPIPNEVINFNPDMPQNER